MKIGAQQNNRISVIVPVFNGEKFLNSAVENILAQSCSASEIIIVDDGSTDGTAALAKAYKERVRYVYQANSGPAAARNLGLRLATGGLISFLDVDDLWPLCKLKAGLRYLKENPDVDIFQGLIQQMTLKKSNPGTVDMQFEISSEPYQFINLGSAIYRKSVFNEVGNFDEALFDNEDTDWFIRAWEKNIIKETVNKVTLYYRLHDENLIWKQKPAQLALLKIFKRYADRKRGSRMGVVTKRVGLKEYIGKPPALKEAAQKAPSHAHTTHIG